MRGVPAEGGSEAYLRVRRSAARARQSAYGGQMGLFQQPVRHGTSWSKNIGTISRRVSTHFLIHVP